jgi:hypothetical protein
MLRPPERAAYTSIAVTARPGFVRLRPYFRQDGNPMKIQSVLRVSARKAVPFGLPGLLMLATAAHAAAPASKADRLEQAWHNTIVNTPVPAKGCFTASYPDTTWKPTACGVAPNIPLVPRTGFTSQTVGDGNDYSAVVSGLISKTVGTFPKITGLKSESGGGSANAISLQINSQFFASPTCSGAQNPQSCQGWEQFVYLTGYGVFMQYWLINYGDACPKGWNAYRPDCYKNSSLVSAPSFPIKKLHTVTLSGSAVASGIDTVAFSLGKKAYSTTGEDSVMDLAAYWNASEWNVFGPGGGSQAVFNAGTSITVNTVLTDGLQTAPNCQSDDGTTGETNNLNLGPCTATGGAAPAVQFTETLAK